jgi:uncharacterized phage-associated protein
MTNGSAPTTAAAVANAFLDLQNADPDRGKYSAIDQMKLYKLVYYAQAWWLAHTSAPLFEEDVHAWPWGPVVPELYGHFKSAGRDPIQQQRATTIKKTGTGFLEYTFVEPEKPSQPILGFLKQVWDIHKSYSGVALSNATHADGEPWTIVKDLHSGDLSSKPLIPIDVIKDVFKRKLSAGQPA